MENKTQSINVKGIMLAVNLSFSVPQGYLLGAPLYCKYTNPVGHIVRLFHILFHGYADDSQLYKSINPSNDNIWSTSKVHTLNNILDKGQQTENQWY